MPVTVQLNMIRKKHEIMINYLTLNSWQLILNGLLMLTRNYFFIHVLLTLQVDYFTLQYLFSHPLFLVDDLVPPPQLHILQRK